MSVRRGAGNPPVAAYVAALLDVMEGGPASRPPHRHGPAAVVGGGAEPSLEITVHALSGLLRSPAATAGTRRGP